jgi:hypothetical protein
LNAKTAAASRRFIYATPKLRAALDPGSGRESDRLWTKRVILQAIRKDEARRAPSRCDMHPARWLRYGDFVDGETTASS